MKINKTICDVCGEEVFDKKIEKMFLEANRIARNYDEINAMNNDETPEEFLHKQIKQFSKDKIKEVVESIPTGNFDSTPYKEDILKNL